MPEQTFEGLSTRVNDRLMRERILFLDSAIDDAAAGLLCAQLLLLASESSEDIRLYINSPGGSVTAGLAIYDTMQYIKPDIATYCLGMAASMGQFLLCAGQPGKRYALPLSSVMMHQPSGGIGGTASDIRIQAENMMHMKVLLTERTAFHTGQSVETITRDSDRDRWFTAEQAKGYGFVDHVLDYANKVLPTE
jgi:ATP-dependent Clp protease protease subunit